ncbi:MAG: ABC transporter permease [Myxococcaceae bacterium]
MSLRATTRALPTMMRVGFASVIAYRAEMIVWVISTTMPFINLALWSAVSRSGAVLSESGKSYEQPDFIAYFLATFVVRQLTGSWASWEMNFDIRSGKLAMRLLRPIHPLWNYAVENLAAIPLRVVVSLPVVAIMAWTVGMGSIPTSLVQWALVLVSFLGGWLITLFVNLAMGSLALHMESSIKVMDVYLSVYFVFSGYIVPVDLFPEGIRAFAQVLPFRYQIGLPTEIFIGRHPFGEALPLLAAQWAWVAVTFGLTWIIWRTGLRRFEAYGG